MTTIFREDAGRQHSNERHNTRALGASPLCPTWAGEKAGVTITFPLDQRFHICLCMLSMVPSLLSLMGGKNNDRWQIHELMVVVGRSGMISSWLKEGYIERHQILIRSE